MTIPSGATADGVGGEWATARDALCVRVATLTGLPVAHEATAGQEAPVVLVQPVALTPRTGADASTRAVTTVDVTVTVLVTVLGGDPAERTARMADLALSALGEGTWDVDPQGPQPWLWRSLGLPARPGLLVRVPVRRALQRRSATPVRRLRTEHMPVLTLSGRVLAGDGTPVPAAVVTLLPHGPDVTTDHRGRFAVRAAVPAGLGPRVHVAARGVSSVLRLEPTVDGVLGDLTLPALVP